MNLVLNTGGAANPAGKEGLSSMTASLLDTGTKTRSAIEIANQLQSIGANLGAGSSWDQTNVSLQTLTRNLDKALDIYSDVVTNPTFPANEMETQRRRTLVAFEQQKDNPNAISNIAYNALLYGKGHPYGKSLSGNKDSIADLKREDVVNFYESYYRPNNAALIVVGDIDAKTLIPKLEKSLAGWKAGEVSAISTPDAETFDNPGIYIVDKPGAAQSVISIGQIGVARDNPDYIPLLVMNSILGGQFSARVNMNLREDKGYTYGARSGFAFRRGAGPFSASADVKTAVTKESVMEFMKELNGIRGAIPVTKEELEYNKQSIIRRFPRTVETVGQISGGLAELYVYDLPASYYNEYIQKVNAVTLEDVNRVANKYLTPDKMAIVIVGDKTVIEPKLKEIDVWGEKILFLDTEGNLIN
jgi:zinc protease